MEVPLITPFGHIVGQRCFEKWRQTCELNDQAVNLVPPAVSICIFNCGHIISPLFAFDPENSPKIRKEEVPGACFDWYIESPQHAEEIGMLEDGYRTLDGQRREL